MDDGMGWDGMGWNGIAKHHQTFLKKTGFFAICLQLLYIGLYVDICIVGCGGGDRRGQISA
jgi:hypothetical protein